MFCSDGEKYCYLVSHFFVCAHEGTEPSVGVVKFTLTPQSTLINTTAAYKQHTGAEYTEAPPFLFPLPLTFSHIHTEGVKQVLACVNGIISIFCTPHHANRKALKTQQQAGLQLPHPSGKLIWI